MEGSVPDSAGLNLGLMTQIDPLQMSKPQHKEGQQHLVSPLSPAVIVVVDVKLSTCHPKIKFQTPPGKKKNIIFPVVIDSF